MTPPAGRPAPAPGDGHPLSHQQAYRYAARPGEQFSSYPAPPPAHSQRERRSGAGTIAAVALVAALIGGAGGAGIMYGLIEPTGDETSVQQPIEARTVASDGAVNWAVVADEVRPSVVAIESMTDTAGSTGSGVVIDADGHIITNHHVIAGSRQILVTLSNGTIIEADVIGSDASTDIAVIQLRSVPDSMSPATLGTSENLVVGEPVVAIGNPLGLSSTVTTGIISALDRPVVTREDSTSDAVVTNAIQIDAAINPGNSGGPLFNASGEVIGINSSIASLSSADGGTAGSIGLGFAIPIDLANRVAVDLLDDGSVDHAFIGVTTTSEIVSAGGSNQVAARVVEVSPGSPAEQYGLQSGDAILSINGDRLASNTALTGYVRQYAPNETVILEVARDGDVTEIELVLGQRE
ncbi:S1C family serine protease [Flaviflexus huanghaiensis]|uniref:S1C family serine protease n=1 Tax=Flaviflexus huanghaiensis TaxID=1111473 RepID=UPI0015F93981|nr:trypsin-like peptidase domain-containing protein [Flaviflexus huanghaiensis]